MDSKDVRSRRRQLRTQLRESMSAQEARTQITTEMPPPPPRLPRPDGQPQQQQDTMSSVARLLDDEEVESVMLESGGEADDELGSLGGFSWL